MAYFDLGSYARSVTTTSDEAQTWFDRGLRWTYGFNHEEAAACFRKAIAADPGCAMAYWGLAYAIGPNYNKPWDLFEPDEKIASLHEGHVALDTARTLSGLAPVETALIEALATRYPTDPEIEDFGPWNDSFTAAMRPVYEAHPNDFEAVAIFVEAGMNRTPWLLWDLDKGAPADGASTSEVRAALESALERIPGAWDHPGLLHLYIHLMEMSPWPELALSHGDRLCELVPDSGHLQHMATHIDVLCGDYQNVIARNQQAAAVDRKYEDYAGSKNFYTLYRIHNVHFVAYGAMFIGRKSQALDAANALRELLSIETVAFLPDLFEAFWGVRFHVLVRFGMWQEIVDEPFPEDAELFSFSTALQHYARTVALSNLGHIGEAQAERDLFRTACAAVPETRYMFNNPAKNVLDIAHHMAEGELAYKSENVEEGLWQLRAAVDVSDGLLYDEPWGWMQPPRHALAALLLEQGRHAEAEAIYRADLGLDGTLARAVQHPRNVWSMHGLDECLAARGETVERPHVQSLLAQAVARSDVPIRSSCFCRNNTD
ncbi:MAG: tetratricopeptide (TPR) repeat protein [Gammaproteobacteria bacterium]